MKMARVSRPYTWIGTENISDITINTVRVANTMDNETTHWTAYFTNGDRMCICSVSQDDEVLLIDRILNTLNPGGQFERVR